MGSLMSGWDSPVLDPESLTLKRNRSLTRGEIEAFWKSKKKTEEEHLRAVTSSPPHGFQEDKFESGKMYQRSSSLPLANTKEDLMTMDTETDLQKLIKKNGWWTKSNWAFLNEPPLFEGNSNTYAAQFHVANLKQNSNNAGISAN